MQNPLHPIFLSSSDCFKYIFKRPVSLSDILLDLLGKDSAKIILQEILAYELGASWMTGTATPTSDLDVDIQVNSLQNFESKLVKLQLKYIHRPVDLSQTVFGYHEHIMFYPGKYQGIEIQINAEKYPPDEQRLIIMTKFTCRYYLDHPDEHERVLRLRNMAEQNLPGGYRKSGLLLYEDIMRKDLGYCPKRTDTDPLGRTFPKWEGRLDPQDWIYLRGKHGLDKAKKIVKEIMDNQSV